MINVEVNPDQVKELLLQKIEERLKELDQEVFFMNTRQMLRVVNLSWNTFNEIFLSDPRFPVVRLGNGNKFLYPRKEVFDYLDKFYIAVRDDGGDIYKYVRK